MWRNPALRQADSEGPLIGRSDIPAQRLEGEILTDAVEKGFWPPEKAILIQR